MGCMYDLFPATFAITIMPFGHFFARRRETLIFSSSCLLAGRNLSWSRLRWASVVRLGWDIIECVL